MVNDPDPNASAFARKALKRIDPEAAAKAGVKMKNWFTLLHPPF